jgi:hypothetical protein
MIQAYACWLSILDIKTFLSCLTWDHAATMNSSEVPQRLKGITLPQGTSILTYWSTMSCAAAACQKAGRHRIGDRRELLPLAERWLDEVQKHATAVTYYCTPSVPTSEENDNNNHDTGSN